MERLATLAALVTMLTALAVWFASPVGRVLAVLVAMTVMTWLVQRGHAWKVADEVRNLSQRTNQFSDQIRTHMGSVHESLAKAHDTIHAVASMDMNFALQSKHHVQDTMQRIEQINSAMAGAANDINLRAGQVAERVNRLNAVNEAKQAALSLVAANADFNAGIEQALQRSRRLNEIKAVPTGSPRQDHISSGDIKLF